MTFRIGGFHGQIDEFYIRDNFSTSFPAEPIQAVLRVSELGGFGDGSKGDVTLIASCIMNTSAKCTIGGNALTISNTQTGFFGGFSPADEVMILNNETGAYEFRTIRSISGSIISLNVRTTITGSDCQVITVPNFRSLTVNSGVTVTCAKFQNNNGGVVIFRCLKDCTINGSIITLGLGRTRTDSMQLTHANLIDNFLPMSGGNIMIFCGGTFTASSSARLGATWDGSGAGGTPNARTKGGDGGAGYGGAGGSDVDNGGLGGKGGVGGAGGGGDGSYGGDAGGVGRAIQSGFRTNTAGTGGAAGQWTNHPAGQGGIQGNPSLVLSSSSGGGGGAGGTGGNSNDGRGGYSGANLILIAKTLKADASAISTGGEGGYSNAWSGGGGGTGFCYIACEEAE